eukprot:scaffold34157_cov52-Attheya_sp.AAC.4
MSFVHDRAYDDDHVFSQDELAPLQPDDIERWMCVPAPMRTQKSDKTVVENDGPGPSQYFLTDLKWLVAFSTKHVDR